MSAAYWFFVLTLSVDQEVTLVDHDGTTETRVIDDSIAVPIRYTEDGRMLVVHTNRDLVFRLRRAAAACRG